MYVEISIQNGIVTKTVMFSLSGPVTLPSTRNQVWVALMDSLSSFLHVCMVRVSELLLFARVTQHI